MTVKVFLLICLLETCLITKSQQFKTEKEFKTYLLENNQTLDPIEGVWEFSKNLKIGFRDNGKAYKNMQFPSSNIDVFPYKVAIVKVSENNFFCYYVNILERLSEIDDACGNYWFKTTAIDGQYIYDVGASCKESYHAKAIINSNGDLVFNGNFEETKEDVFSWNNFTVTATKLSPTTSEIRNYNNGIIKKDEAKPKFVLGTGFAISNYLIMTCYHVVKNSKQISIRGIDGNFKDTYLASIRYFDESLDMAYLELKYNITLGISTLPYKLKLTPTDVGTNVFVLGYPMQNTMGEEIKLTTGVISSNSGFRGDTTLFQISAPIQPGNSGGPLFDNRGNVIGLVTAKHLQADNVGYATKLYIEKDLLNKISLKTLGIKNNQVDLSNKVKLYKRYIYSVEVLL